MNLRELADLVTKQTGYNIRVKSRKQEYTLARAIYFKLARDFRLGTITAIAKEIDKHHATVLHSNKNVFPQMDLYFPKFYDHYLFILHTFAGDMAALQKHPDVALQKMITKLRLVPEKKLNAFEIRFNELVDSIL